jgi:hypothetical protein
MVAHVAISLMVKRVLTSTGVMVAAGKIREILQRSAKAKASLAQAKSAQAYHAGQIEIIKKNQQHEFEMEKFRQEHARDLQFKKQSLNIDEKNWPLTISPKTYAGMGVGHARQPLILTYFPPRLPDDHLTNTIAAANEISINDFLMKGGYSPIDSERPVRFIGDWNRGGARANSALETLYHYAPHVPTALIQLDHIGDDLNLMAGCFGFSAADPSPPILSASGQVPWGERATSAMRADMEELQNALHFALQKEGIDASLLGDQVLLNLQLLNLEKATGRSLDKHFRLTSDHLRSAAEVVQPSLHLLAAGMADFYHWTRYQAAPRLPALFSQIATDFPDSIREELTQKTLRNYAETYSYLASMEGKAAPLMLLKLAQALAETQGLFDRKPIESIIIQAIESFRQQNSLDAKRSLQSYARRATKPDDKQFFQLLANVYSALGDVASAESYTNTKSFSSRQSNGINSGSDDEEYAW